MRQKKLPINGPLNGAPVSVQAPFPIIGSPIRCFFYCFPVFCTAEFLARTKFKSKAKKTTEKLESTQKNI